LRKLIKIYQSGELEALKIKIKVVFFTLSNITDNKMEYIHTQTITITMIFVIGYGHHAIYPIHDLLSKMDVNMLMVVLVI
jgi:hypothetical protein